MGLKLQTCSGNDYITLPLPAKLILSEKELYRVKDLGELQGSEL